jgi:hypothetical protein
MYVAMPGRYALLDEISTRATIMQCFLQLLELDGLPNAKWSRATLPLFSNSTLPYFSANDLSQPSRLL